MREIKFRAWNKTLQKMVDLNGSIQTGHGLNSLFIDDDLDFMQYTGLKDKNDKEIYEGDIVNWGANDAIEIGFGWGDDAEAYGESFGVLIGASVFCGAHKDCEVVGNIYENPELLK